MYPLLASGKECTHQKKAEKVKGEETQAQRTSLEASENYAEVKTWGYSQWPSQGNSTLLVSLELASSWLPSNFQGIP